MPASGDSAILWPTVRRTFERMQTHQPEGRVPRIRITLVDGENFEPLVVQEVGDWLFFEADEAGEELTPWRRVIAVRPNAIRSIEIRYIPPDGKEVGFRVDPPGDVIPNIP
jgi:hypothetical protein